MNDYVDIRLLVTLIMMNWNQLLSPLRFGESSNKSTFGGTRSAFEADYDRIIFSRPFRNLQDKTQVFPLPDQDFVHTRLTHSLEVSSVGRSLGKIVGDEILSKHKDLKNISSQDLGSIVGAAALAHDVGNPPFGHSGETAISDYFKFNPSGKKIKDLVSKNEWSDLTNFEGNAQGFRLLTRNHRQGLKLTLPTLAAFSKYPCPSNFRERIEGKKSQKKYGFFDSDEKSFGLIAKELGLVPFGTHSNVWCRHPLTFLVEAADDICYNIIDLEDGFGLGLVNFDEVRTFLAKILKDQYMPDKLAEIPSDQEKIGVLRAVAINCLIQECANVFMENEEKILAGEFDYALTDMIASKDIMEEIGNFSIKRLYQSHLVLEKEASGFEVIDGLLQSFIEAVYNKFYENDKYSGRSKSLYRLLPTDTQYRLENECQSAYDHMLVVTDYISGMTDSSALKTYRTIKGIDLG
ncbi:deoxyguanosinetriphosphate triphosphohydrolase [Reichenbachiella versicolor]|uniref:deoxyguanosinetriphosphate triphosphohydrolase n=1 Tax=Reichenbachiella versicolor TaxID=1821036 RepID=UPI001FE6C147|nr:deoxyguanosinetriphosphate triphosphohydrolase [Reichenbachiella versicolor]